MKEDCNFNDDWLALLKITGTGDTGSSTVDADVSMCECGSILHEHIHEHNKYKEIKVAELHVTMFPVCHSI